MLCANCNQSSGGFLQRMKKAVKRGTIYTIIFSQLNNELVDKMDSTQSPRSSARWFRKSEQGVPINSKKGNTYFYCGRFLIFIV